MKRTTVIFAAFALFGIADAQTMTFQFGGKALASESLSGKTVTGRPITATEERHTLQILGDGTRIENTETDKFYRDGLGRTRIERSNGVISIQDPVQGVTAEVNGKNSTLRHVSPMPTDPITIGKVEAELAALAKDARKIAAEGGRKQEDLGYQSVNGVTAQGSRTTTTIPAGQIGNDRAIQIVSERWFSPDLQMNIKTTNSDPRFGETTYQLTNIVQGSPDASLFQIPAESKRE